MPDISPRAQAAAGGLLLLGCLWLPWYTASGDTGDAWQAFSGLDYTLAVLAVGAITGAALSLWLRAWTIWTTISLGGGLAVVRSSRASSIRPRTAASTWTRRSGRSSA